MVQDQLVRHPGKLRGFLRVYKISYMFLSVAVTGEQDRIVKMHGQVQDDQIIKLSVSAVAVGERELLLISSST